MPSFVELIQQSTAHAWLFIPSAILLGALHGLEPGHSKTMMAAFIVAIRGTVTQAILLGVAATISHTIIVWAIALGGLYLWQGLDAEYVEPYLQLASAAIIIAIAVWMLWRTWQDQQRAAAAQGHHNHDHPHGAGHSHGDHDHGDHDYSHHHHNEEHGRDARRIDTGHGVIEVEVYEDGVPPQWRIQSVSGQVWLKDEVTLTTERPDGSKQTFGFVGSGRQLISQENIPEPHEFMVRISLRHGGHTHDYDLSFVEGHGHDHLHEGARGLELATDGYQDAHELAHANDIRRKFADRNVTTGQVILFGLTGGLIPCPAAVTVLLLCLQLKQIPLGVVLVLCFSIGLAITLVAVGVAAALSVHHASKRFGWFNSIAARAPYASGVLIILVGVYLAIQGWTHLPTA